MAERPPIFPQCLIEQAGEIINEVLTFENFRTLDDEQIGYLILVGMHKRGLLAEQQKASEGGRDERV